MLVSASGYEVPRKIKKKKMAVTLVARTTTLQDSPNESLSSRSLLANVAVKKQHDDVKNKHSFDMQILCIASQNENQTIKPYKIHTHFW